MKGDVKFMSMILNVTDLGPDLDPDKRLYIGGEDDLTDAQLAMMNQELYREDRLPVKSEVKEATRAILNTNKKQIPRRKPIIDWKTKNTSFLELHEDLKM